MFTKKLNRKGFSLVELLVVIAIIATLSVVAYTAVGGNTAKARDAKRKQDLNTIQSALEIMKTETGVYPNSPLVSGAGAGQVPKKYLSTIPTDPDGTAYIYTLNGTATAYQLAAALEGDGTYTATTGMRPWVVGNSDTDLINNGLYVTFVANAYVTTGNLCGDATEFIVSNLDVCQAANEDTPATCSCIPYDPR